MTKNNLSLKEWIQQVKHSLAATGARRWSDYTNVDWLRLWREGTTAPRAARLVIALEDS